MSTTSHIVVPAGGAKIVPGQPIPDNPIIPYIEGDGIGIDITPVMKDVVDAAVAPWGVKVNRIEIKDIVPPTDLVEAMGRQMKAERVKRADILQAEGQRQSDILRAEGAKQSQILEAEGRREAAFRDAEGRERLAQAEAKATEMVSKAVAEGDIAALNYFIAEKYVKAFGQIAESPNQKIVMIPYEATQILGTLAGIGEIAKATFGGEGGGATPPAGGGSRWGGSVPRTGPAGGGNAS